MMLLGLCARVRPQNRRALRAQQAAEIAPFWRDHCVFMACRGRAVAALRRISSIDLAQSFAISRGRLCQNAH